MLKINLATRPFYNERLVDVVLFLLGAGAVALMLFGGRTVLQLSDNYDDSVKSAEVSETQTRAISEQIVALNENVSRDELASLRVSAAEANRLIDQRVFSWTGLLNVIERTLPDRVMLTSLRPTGTAGEMLLRIGVIGEHVADIEDFIKELEATGSVRNVLARQEQRTDDGMYSALLIGEFDGESTGPNDDSSGQ